MKNILAFAILINFAFISYAQTEILEKQTPVEKLKEIMNSTDFSWNNPQKVCEDPLVEKEFYKEIISKADEMFKDKNYNLYYEGYSIDNTSQYKLYCPTIYKQMELAEKTCSLVDVMDTKQMEGFIKEGLDINFKYIYMIAESFGTNSILSCAKNKEAIKTLLKHGANPEIGRISWCEGEEDYYNPMHNKDVLDSIKELKQEKTRKENK